MEGQVPNGAMIINLENCPLKHEHGGKDIIEMTDIERHKYEIGIAQEVHEVHGSNQVDDDLSNLRAAFHAAGLPEGFLELESEDTPKNTDTVLLPSKRQASKPRCHAHALRSLEALLKDYQ